MSDPDVDDPDVETPTDETPDVDAPDVETPTDEAPDAETPEVDSPDVDTPTFEIPAVDGPVVDAPTTRFPVVARLTRGTTVAVPGGTDMPVLANAPVRSGATSTGTFTNVSYGPATLARTGAEAGTVALGGVLLLLLGAGALLAGRHRGVRA